MGALLLLTAAEAGTAKAAELDGDLITMYEETVTIEQESNRLWKIACARPDDFSDTHPAFVAYDTHEDATLSRRAELVDAVIETPARTPEGLRAKSAVARSAVPQERVDEGDPCDRLALSLCADRSCHAGTNGRRAACRGAARVAGCRSRRTVWRIPGGQCRGAVCPVRYRPGRGAVMTGRIVAFRPPGSEPVTPPVKFPDPPFPNRPPGTRKGGSRAKVIPFTPRPKQPTVAAHKMAERALLLADFAKEWGISIAILDGAKGVQP